MDARARFSLALAATCGCLHAFASTAVTTLQDSVSASPGCSLKSQTVCEAQIISGLACSTQKLLEDAQIRAVLQCDSLLDCQSKCMDGLGQLGLPVNHSSPVCSIKEQLMAQYSGHPSIVVNFAEDPITKLKKPSVLPSGLAGSTPFPYTSYLGDHQGCLLGDGMQYCLAEGALAAGKLKLIGMLGLCRPSDCSPDDVIDQIKPVADLMGLSDFQVTCKSRGAPKPEPLWTSGQKAALLLFSGMLACLLLGTLASMQKWGHGNNCQAPSTSTEGSSAVGRLPRTVGWAKAGGLAFVDAWSVPRNLASFVRSRPHKDDQFEPALGVLDGLRVLSMLWVLLGHTVIWPLLSIQYENPGMLLPPHGRLTEVWFQVVPGGYFAVDTFFWLSGFLGARTLHSKVRKSPRLLTAKGFCLQLYPGSIFARWIRLSMIYAFILIFSQTWYRELGRGALLWDAKFPALAAGGSGCAFSIDNDDCKQNWWSNLLYLNNLLPKSGSSGCLAHTWYLACDMQLFLLVPLLVLLRERAGKAAGWTVLTLLTLASVLATVWETASKDEVTDPVLGNFGGGRFMQDVYQVSWLRAPPYLLGVGFAWLLDAWSSHQEKVRPRPEEATAMASQMTAPSLLRQGAGNDVRQATELGLKKGAGPAGDVEQGRVAVAGRQVSPAVETSQATTGRMPLLSTESQDVASVRGMSQLGQLQYVSLALLIQLASFGLMCFVVFVPVTRYRCTSLLACASVETAPWSKAANVLYPSLSHFAWGLGLGGLLSLCFVRAPGTWWINTLLGHHNWQIPMKLTYTAYLVHPLVLVFFYCVRDGAVRFQDSTLLLDFVAFAVFVFSSAFLLWITVEKPMGNLSARLLASLGMGSSDA